MTLSFDGPPSREKVRAQTDAKILSAFDGLKPITVGTAVHSLGFSPNNEYYRKVRGFVKQGLLQEYTGGKRRTYTLTTKGQNLIAEVKKATKEKAEATHYRRVKLLSQFCLQPKTRGQVLGALRWPTHRDYYETFRWLEDEGMIQEGMEWGRHVKFTLTRAGEAWLDEHWEVLKSKS